MNTKQQIQNEEAPEEHHRLAPGWHHTDKFGDIFISPDGSAWIVQQSGDRLTNVMVNLNPTDIIKTAAIDKVKHAQAMRAYRKRSL